VIFIVSGPGGVGKGTIVKQLVRQDPSLFLSRSWTTRERREGEDADAYEFVSVDQFREHADAGGFLEWVEFLGNFYGTPVPNAPAGRDLLLEIELEGGQKVKALHGDAVLILIVPPSIEVQRQRLQKRGESAERIDQRIEKGRYEMQDGAKIADATIINDDLDTAVRALGDIINRYRTNSSTEHARPKS
jgi:guanylate kinase